MEPLTSNKNLIRFGLRTDTILVPYQNIARKRDRLDLRPSKLWLLHPSSLVNGCFASQTFCQTTIVKFSVRLAFHLGINISG
jgi:hypothetical protein